MQKTLIIAKREFSQRIRQRGFWLMSIGVPLVFIIIWLVFGSMDNSAADEPPSESEQADRPAQVVGYVDQANFIQKIPTSIPPDIFRPLANVQAAEAALAQGDIGAYFVIPADYRETDDVQRVSQRLAVNASDVGWFNRLLEANLLPETDPAQIERLQRPFYAASPEFVNTSPEGQSTPRGNSILPLTVTIAVIMPLFTGATYLFQSLSQEKSSRIMEILLVSLLPRHLLTGKILGLGALTLVQYLLWGAIGLLVGLVSGQGAARLLASISLASDEVLWVVSFALSGFLLYAALMAGIGALVRDIEDGRTWLFAISLPMMIPIYLWTTIARNPDGLLAVVLSLIPFSAPVAMLMRLTSGVVPTWQVVLSLGLLLLTALGTIWLMARLFRVRTLLSGEPISMRRMWAALMS